MKKFAFAFGLLCLASISAFAQSSVTESRSPNRSAFVANNHLYLTILGSSCNNESFFLVLDRACKADRGTREATFVCNARTSAMTTAMYCANRTPKAHVYDIDLKLANVTSEAKFLILDNGTPSALKVQIYK